MVVKVSGLTVVLRAEFREGETANTSFTTRRDTIHGTVPSPCVRLRSCERTSMSALVEHPYILIGDKNIARDREALRREHVRYVINVTPPLTSGGVANFFEKEGTIEYLRLPLRDVAVDSILPHVSRAVEFLQRVRVRADGCVLVHCNEGKSRSAAIVIAFLMRAYGYTFDDALAAVRAVRPRAEPRDSFERQLRTIATATLPCDVDGWRAPSVGSSSSNGIGPTAASKRIAGPIGPAAPPPKRPAIGPQRPAIGPAPPPSVAPESGPAARTEQRGVSLAHVLAADREPGGDEAELHAACAGPHAGAANSDDSDGARDGATPRPMPSGSVIAGCGPGEIGPGRQCTRDDDKQRAYDAWVECGMRGALRARAEDLCRATPCGLRALQMVEIGQRLWIHVVLNGQKQRVGCAVLRALQGSEMQRDEWCLPNNAGRLVNHGINHNVESFRRDMQNAGQNYDEILGQLLPEAGEETNSTIEDLLQWLEDMHRPATYNDVLRMLEEDPEELLRALQTVQRRMPLGEAEEHDEAAGHFRSLGYTSRGQVGQDELATRLARVRAELAQHLPRLRALGDDC